MIFECDTLETLLDKVVTKGWHPPKQYGIKVPVVTQLLWMELDCFLGKRPPVDYQVDPPSSVAALLHNNVLQVLMEEMDVESAQALKEVERV